MSSMRPNTAPTHEIDVRLTVRKVVHGRVTSEKKHKTVVALKHVLATVAQGYTVVSAEVADVRHG
jgi:hypothetical protein